MNYIVYKDLSCILGTHEHLEDARATAIFLAKINPSEEIFLAQKISTFISQVSIKET